MVATKTPNRIDDDQDESIDPSYEDNANYDDDSPKLVGSTLADLEWNTARQRQGKSYTDSHGDTIKNNYNADDDTDDPNSNILSAGKKESAGSKAASTASDLASGLSDVATGGSGMQSFVGGLLGKGGKSKGPTAGVTGILVLLMAGVGGSSIGLASSLLINIKEILHNDRADGTRTNRLFSRAFWSNKFNSQDSACKSGIEIKCKLSTMSKEDVKQLLAEDFKVTGAEIDPKTGQPTGDRIENDKSLQPGAQQSTNNTNTSSTQTSNPDARVSIEKIEFPDGKTVTSGKEFYDHADKNISAMRTSERAFNSKSSFYLNKFFDSKVLGKWNISKAQKEFPEKKDGESEEDLKKRQDQAFNEQTDGLSEEDKKNGKLKPKVDEAANEAEKHGKARSAKAVNSGNVLLSVVQTACSVYKLARGAVAAVKIYQTAQLVKFGVMFFQAADEIKDGRGLYAKTAYLSDNLTYYESNKTLTEDDSATGAKAGDPNEKYGLSAPDSQGYEIAAMGDTTTTLTDFAKTYILGGSGIASDLNDTISTVDTIVGYATFNKEKGRERVKQFCRALNGKFTVIAGTCGSVAVGLGLFGTAAAPGIGSAIGLGLGAAACACAALDYPTGFWGKVTDFVADTAGCTDMANMVNKGKEELIGWMMRDGSPIRSFIEKVLNEVSVGSDTKGVDAGNAIASGVGLMLSTTATGYGLKPAVKTDENDTQNKEVTDYIAYTQPLEDKYIALEKDDARLSPFDASNQYSLLGTAIRGLNLSDITPTSLYGNTLTILGLIPSAFKTSLGQPVSALYNQPSTAANGASGRYDCKDDDMNYILATGDKFCSIVGVSMTSELESATKTIEESGQGKDMSDTEMGKILDFMLQEGDYKDAGEKTVDQGGTGDNTNGDCAKLDGGEDEKEGGFCKMSKQASIDKTGAVVPDSQYQKYLVYCTEQRAQPWGAQAEAYEQGTDRDQDWYSGKMCTDNSGNEKDSKSVMLKYFRMYTNYCLQSATRDKTLSCADSTPPAATGGNWIMPTSGVCTSPYGQRWGTLHAGIDIAPASGTPIVAPTDMKIISAGDKGDGYGNSVVARATDGTNYMFRFGHMLNTPSVSPGQEVAKGTEIGQVGSTGNSTGPHLHFEIYDPGSPDGAYKSNGTPLDPIPILQQHGANPPSC